MPDVRSFSSSCFDHFLNSMARCSRIRDFEAVTRIKNRSKPGTRTRLTSVLSVSEGDSPEYERNATVRAIGEQVRAECVQVQRRTVLKIMQFKPARSLQVDLCVCRESQLLNASGHSIG